MPRIVAPTMFIDWNNNNIYDMISIDWRCDIDAVPTYWAVHQFATSGSIDGYAGFLSTNVGRRLLFSMWEKGTKYPEMEYISPFIAEDLMLFDNDGLGKRCVTLMPWDTSTWYTMCMGAKTMCGKTYYSQWVKKAADTDWILCGVISFPQEDKAFPAIGLFQENYAFDNLSRKCHVKRASGRRKDNGTWECRTPYKITNRYVHYTINDVRQDYFNVNYNCMFGTTSNPFSVYIQAGGNTTYNNNPTPISGGLASYTPSPSETPPTNAPTFAPLVPRFIESSHSHLYIKPNSSNQVVQGAAKYYWIFEDSGDGYFYILTKDKAMAITVNSDMATLSMTTFTTGNDNQKWTKHSYPQSLDVYFTPKVYPSRCWDLTNGSYAEGAIIKLWNYNENTPQFKFTTKNTVTFRTIQNNFTSLYVAPSGSDIVQSSSAYKWLFVKADDDYYYILTPDCTKAVSVNGTYAGANLILSDFVPGNNKQKWKMEDAGTNICYLRPLSPSTMTMDPENASYTPGTPVQIWTYNTTSPQFKWIVTEQQSYW